MILLVLHEIERGENIARGLQARGHAVLCLPDVDDVLDRLTHTDPAVILVDLSLKDPSGLEVLRTLRAHGYKGKVIALADMSVSTETPEVFDVGADHVLRGLIGLDQVEWAIRSVLGSAVTKNVLSPP